MSFFDSNAIHTFAHGVASLTSNQVIVEVRGRCAYTDGRTVVLPAEGLWDKDGFRALCGIACHEISHVWFRSNDHLVLLYQKLPQVNSARVQRAFNSIVDVADETRFERAMPPARLLFEATRDHVYREIEGDGILPPLPTQLIPEDQLLALGILWSRSHARSVLGKQLRKRFRNVPGLAEVVSRLTKARDSRGGKGNRFHPNRTVLQWKKLFDLTIQLIAILDRFYPAQSTQEIGNDAISEGQASISRLIGPSDMSERSSEDHLGDNVPGQGMPHSPRTLGVLDPIASWMEAAKNSATERALTTVGNELIEGSFDWNDLFGEEKSLDQFRIVNSVCGNSGEIGFRQELYDQVWPAFKRISQSLATGPTLTREDGFLAGGRLSRLHRASIDGRCFQRVSWEDEPDAATAFVFDQSESMEQFLDVFLPVGAALVDAFRAVANVQIKILRYGSYVESVRSTSELRVMHTMGSTATHAAIQAAAEWLEVTSTNRRTIVLFTDGEPDEVSTTRESVFRLQSSGIALLVGAIGLTESQCAHSMPGAYVFSVDPRNAASSLHVAANRLRRQSLNH